MVLVVLIQIIYRQIHSYIQINTLLLVFLFFVTIYKYYQFKHKVRFVLISIL